MYIWTTWRLLNMSILHSFLWSRIEKKSSKYNVPYICQYSPHKTGQESFILTKTLKTIVKYPSLVRRRHVQKFLKLNDRKAFWDFSSLLWATQNLYEVFLIDKFYNSLWKAAYVSSRVPLVLDMPMCSSTACDSAFYLRHSVLFLVRLPFCCSTPFHNQHDTNLCNTVSWIDCDWKLKHKEKVKPADCFAMKGNLQMSV